jgi:chromosome partitioning protein
MAITMTLGIQKGGASKSTSAAVLGYLLSQEYKVLCIDLDSQGNLSEVLSQKTSNEFVENSVLEGLQQNNLKKYIVPISDHLDLLPANNFLATFPRWLYTKKTYLGESISYEGNPSLVLDRSLEAAREEYDFIIIDTPPSLSEQTTNALCASDFIIVMYECSNWCYSAIPNFMDSVEAAKQVSTRKPEVIGILRTMNDVRRSDAKAFNELIEEDYPDLVFQTIITRKAPIGRISLYGFNENPELSQALVQYQEVYKELIDRVKNR